MTAKKRTGAAGRNLVVFCDGTDNEFGENNTNVVRLFSVAMRDNDQQIAFYDPGLGTFPAPGAWTPLSKWFTKLLGSAFGFGLSQNVADSYRFLMENYAPGDRIYLFGFSRGAYTVRVLAALIHVCGLMHASNRNLVPYAFDLFTAEATGAKKRNDRAERSSGKRQKLDLPVCAHFKQVFSQAPAIHFIGLWDTVSSVGSIYDPFSLPYTRWNPSVRTVRHAISIDEKRKFFRANLWSDSSPDTDVKQVWFAGAHADVGGGYAEKESGLAKIALSWMLEEARAAQLQIDDNRLANVFPGASGDPGLSSPDPMARQHNELEHLRWKIMQWIPRRNWVRNKSTGWYDLKWNFSPRQAPRPIEDNSIIHQSVFERMKGDPAYRPANIPKDARIQSNGQ